MSHHTASPLQCGVRHLEQGEFQAARRCFEKAWEFNPRDAVASNCLGIVARIERRLSDARHHFRRAIVLRPDFAEAYCNLGNTLRDGHELAEAEKCYRHSIRLKPESAEPWNSLGVVHLTRGEIPDAMSCFERAIQFNPAYVEAHNNLANAFSELGDDVAAVASFTTAMELHPHSPEIHNNLANILARLGHRDEARKHLEQAIQLKPDFSDAYGNLGNVLMDLGHSEEAIQAYQHAARLQPRATAPLVNLGNAYRLTGQTEQARHVYIRSASLEPQDRWHLLRMAALCPPVFRSREDLVERRENALTQWRRLADIGRTQGAWGFTSRLVEPSLDWQFLDGNLRELKETYAAIFGNDFSATPAAANYGKPRVGIVVSRGHEGLFLRSLGGVIERISDREFEVAIACPRESEQSIRDGIARNVELVLMPERMDRAAEVLREARFDCLYYWEIGTNATNYFLPLMRLAPIQVTSWGIQVTSGMRTIDYYLSSELVEPPDAASHYTEQLLLSHSLLTHQRRPDSAGPTKDRSQFGLNSEQHVYLCPQQLGKFHPDFDELIAGILRRDEQGIVVGIQDRFGYGARILRERLGNTIPDVASRIHFLPKLAYREYLQLIRQADVLLDPPHFGGVNSTYDALALGQPIVTLPSAFHRGRYTAACYRRMGISQCTATNPDEYVRLAVALATEQDFRNSTRQQIQEAAAELFHDMNSVREHERLFQQLIAFARNK